MWASISFWKARNKGILHAQRDGVCGKGLKIFLSRWHFPRGWLSTWLHYIFARDRRPATKASHFSMSYLEHDAPSKLNILALVPDTIGRAEVDATCASPAAFPTKLGGCHCSSYSENNSSSLSRENWQGYHQRRVARGCSWQQKWGYVNINIQRDSYLLEALAWKRCRDCINITLSSSHPRKFWGQPKSAIAEL